MLCLPSLILSDTSVVARMPRLYGFNRKETDLLPIACDQDAISSTQPVIVEKPDQLNRGISLGNGAGNRRRAIDVEWFIPEFERHDYGEDLWKLERRKT